MHYLFLGRLTLTVMIEDIIHNITLYDITMLQIFDPSNVTMCFTVGVYLPHKVTSLHVIAPP